MLLLPFPALPQQIGDLKNDYTVTPLVRGLQQPDGLAIHPKTRDIYVSERGAGRISVVRGGSASPVIEGGWSIPKPVPNWAVSEVKSRESWMETRLNSPGAIGFTSNGNLFVVEFIPRGRLVEFIPDEQGRYTTASVWPIPWLNRAFAWDDLKIAGDGRVFIAGSDAEVQTGLKFGSVLMRDRGLDWWVVDYGPFVDFSSVCLSRLEDIVVIAERRDGNLAWWDAVRHLPIGDTENIVPGSEIGSVGLLPDGAFVLGEQPGGQQKNALLLRVDPVSGAMGTIAEGFNTIGTILLVPEKGSLLFTDPQAGAVMECAPKTKPVAQEYLLRRSLDGYEMAKGFTPRAAPGFLRNFFGSAGVGIGEAPHAERKGTATDVEEGAGSMGVSFTLRDFATRIPFVAGKVSVQQNPDSKVTDPVTEVNFCLLFPGHAVVKGEMPTPSLSFFSAKRKSGKVEQSKLLLDGLSVHQKASEGQWLELASAGSVTVPLVTCAMRNTESGVQVDLVFLGLGVYEDYYMSLESGVQNQGTLMVEDREGQRHTYQTTFTEVSSRGEEVKNLVVAGFDPMARENVGWLNIGQWPVGAAVGLGTGGEAQGSRFSSVSPELAELIQRKEMELRMAAGVAVSNLEAAATEVLLPAPAAPPEAGAPTGAASRVEAPAATTGAPPAAGETGTVVPPGEESKPAPAEAAPAEAGAPGS